MFDKGFEFCFSLQNLELSWQNFLKKDKRDPQPFSLPSPAPIVYALLVRLLKVQASLEKYFVMHFGKENSKSLLGTFLNACHKSFREVRENFRLQQMFHLFEFQQT